MLQGARLDKQRVREVPGDDYFTRANDRRSGHVNCEGLLETYFLIILFIF